MLYGLMPKCTISFCCCLVFCAILLGEVLGEVCCSAMLFCDVLCCSVPVCVVICCLAMLCCCLQVGAC